MDSRAGLAHLGFELSDQQFEKLLTRVDRDGDGDINYNEFAARLKGQVSCNPLPHICSGCP